MPFVIGLTGPLCAGKQVVMETIAQMLQPRTVTILSLSDAIRAHLKEQGKVITRDTLIAAGNELRAAGGPGAIAQLILPMLSQHDNYIVDSIRNPAEVAVLRTHPNWKSLIAVDAPVLLRYHRCLQRMREKDPMSLEEFLEKDDREMFGTGHSQSIRQCMIMADIFLVNQGSTEDLVTDLRNKIQHLV